MTLQASPTETYRPDQCPTCHSFDPGQHACRLDHDGNGQPALHSLRSLVDAPAGQVVVPCYEYEKALPAGQPEPAPGPTPELSELNALVEQPHIGRPLFSAAEPPLPAIDAELLAQPAPPRGEARLHCARCKAENPPHAARCQQCNAPLLAGESAGARLATFAGMMIAAGVLAFLVYQFYIRAPGTAPDLPFFNPVVLGLAAFLAVVTAFAQLFRRTPEFRKYENRAKRHVPLNLWQSLDDLNQALDLAPDKEWGSLTKQRADVFDKLGRVDDAARDRLALVTAAGAFKGEADLASMITGADADVYAHSRQSGEISTILKAGKARAVGYCPQCKSVVVLTPELRCGEHPKVKGRNVEYVIPADVLAGKLSVMQKMEAGNPQVAARITKLLEAGKASAVGYCPRCKAVVTLDAQRHCTVHPKVKGRQVQYAVPQAVPEARRKIFKSLAAQRAGGSKRIVYILAGLAIIYAGLVLLDVDVAGWLRGLLP